MVADSTGAAAGAERGSGGGGSLRPGAAGEQPTRSGLVCRAGRFATGDHLLDQRDRLDRTWSEAIGTDPFGEGLAHRGTPDDDLALPAQVARAELADHFADLHHGGGEQRRQAEHVGPVLGDLLAESL